MGILRIHLAALQVRANEQITCAVQIAGGRANDTVTIRLCQTAGMDPLYTARSKTQLDATGDGNAIFQVTLAGPATASLHAQEEISAVALAPDDITVKVL
jgi:hypothetical protein